MSKALKEILFDLAEWLAHLEDYLVDEEVVDDEGRYPVDYTLLKMRIQELKG